MNVASLLRHYSIEVIAQDKRAAARCAAALPRGTEVYVAFGRSATHAQLVTLSASLHAAGFVPVPHIVARSLTSYSQLSALLQQLRAVGVDQALLVGGDIAQPAGPFQSSLQVLQTSAFARTGFRRVGLACYPEPHRRIDTAKLQAELAEKLAVLARDGIAAWLVSQFCLESEPIVAMLRTLRGRGITAPLRIGLAGPSDRRTLWKFALSCGIGESIRALGTRTDVIRDLLVRESPDALVHALADGLSAAPSLGVDGVHIFSFGGVTKAASWAHALAEPPDGA